MADIPISIDNVGEWLSGSGPEADIVISTRLRLARNVVGFPFLTRTTDQQRADLEEMLREQIQVTALGDDLVYLGLKESKPVDRLCLVERHLISKDHASGSGSRGVALGRSEMVSIMVNEEDHLRIQVLRSGFQPEEAFEEIRRLDTQLESRLKFAFSSEFGYLTACPTNVGTGMRISVMLHLPGLVMTKQIEKVFHAVSKINLAVRGLYGEGTQASGDFYQISNQVTLGLTEADILKTVQDVVPQIIRYERNVRDTLISENRRGLEDRVWRAFGMLEHSRLITSEETMDLLSAVRMGVNLGMIDQVPIHLVNELFILTQPAHLQKMKGRKLETSERDVNRAEFIRNKLAELN